MKQEIIFLSSGKCSWGKCFACGWGKLKGPEPNLHRLKNIIDKKFKKLKNIDRLKIFVSGSFLDDKQFPKSIRKYIIQKIKENNIKQLVIESRPEFISNESLSDFKGIDLYVAIGLECADNKILKKYNKGYTVEDFVRAAEILHKNNFKVRTYLMVNLPFLKDIKKDLDKSVKFAKKYSDEIVLINTFPHSESALYDLYIKGKWKPLDRQQFDKITKKYKNIEKDFDNFAFIPRFKQKPLVKGATKESLLHPYFEIWQDYIQRFYKNPSKKPVLFLPCAFKKPYSKSKLHKAIFSVVNKDKVHPVVISSPGVIPYEFIDKYPFNKYDWPEWEETSEIKKIYIQVTQKRIEKYLKNHKYRKYYCYLKYDSETYKALSKACKKLKIKLVNILPEHVYEKIKYRKNSLSLPEATKFLKVFK
ncbi:MAG: DUF5591 domain-containing protein [Candidatus Aenigmarchaeota archaeon]|nr:DUF5591 domain-containing protein [Candidatus Aenigmarchaeota archaeon]